MFDLVAFDLYGTLLDISGLAERMRSVTGEASARILGKWRAAQFERTWRLNREGRYEPWDAVTRAALEEVAPGLPKGDRQHLSDLWLTVPAYADAAEALEAIRAAGARSAVLSNGTRPMIEAALSAARIQVDRVLSADDVRVYKTDPRVYALLDGEAARARTLFVSGNGWDAAGARRDGRTVAWIDRGGERPEPPPSYLVESLREVATLLVRPG